MFTTLAVLVYLVALSVPLLLVYCFHSHWYWHALSLIAALGLGFVRTPPEWKTPAFDMCFGAVFVFLLVWGLAGLLRPRHHREKHA